MPEFAMAVYAYYRYTENSSVRIFANRGENIKNILNISLYLYQIDVKKEGEYLLDKTIKNIDTDPQPFNNYIYCMAVSTTGKRKLYGSYENCGKITLTKWAQEGLYFQALFRVS